MRSALHFVLGWSSSFKVQHSALFLCVSSSCCLPLTVFPLLLCLGGAAGGGYAQVIPMEEVRHTDRLRVFPSRTNAGFKDLRHAKTHSSLYKKTHGAVTTSTVHKDTQNEGLSPSLVGYNKANYFSHSLNSPFFFTPPSFRRTKKKYLYVLRSKGLCQTVRKCVIIYLKTQGTKSKP